MRKALAIAFGTLTRTARDRKALALLLLMPLILIAILGSALGKMFTGGRIEPFAIAVINQDQPVLIGPPGSGVTAEFGKLFLDEVLTTKQVRELINAQPQSDVAAAKQQVLAGELAAVVHIPSGFTADALAGKQPDLQLYTDPGRSTPAEIVRQVVRSFTEALTSGMIAAGGKQPGTSEQAATILALRPQISASGSGVKDVSAMQYYAAAMAIMFMVMTAISRAKGLIEEQQSGTMARLITSPTNKATILTGQVIGCVTLLLVQFMILMTGTRLIFGVDWGPFFPALLLGFAFALAASGLGMMIASFLKDPQAADASIGLVGNLLAMLSGGMFPLYGAPEAFHTVAKAIPNYWALQGFLDLMAGLGTASLWVPVAVLALMGLVTGSLGTWRLAAR